MKQDNSDQWIQGLTLIICFITLVIVISLKYYLTGEI